MGAVCTALDGLPLAIELAAARIKFFSPETLLPRLGERLAFLTGGPRDLPRRQQTLRAALDWSYQLLGPEARRLFARLGVFAGPFDAVAAAAVCGQGEDPALMLEHLTDLGEQSLLEVTPASRFRFLETVREYAQARLAESGEQETIRTRHLGFYLTLASEVRAALDRPDRTAWLDRLEEAHPNVRAALGWAWTQAEKEGAWLNEGLGLATAFAGLSRHRGYLVEGSLHLDHLLALDDCRETAAPATRAWALLESSTIACYRVDYPKTIALAQRAIDHFAALGDSSGL